MEIFMFIFGLILFFGGGALITYWIFNDCPEDYFYRSFFCIFEMTVLTILFKIWGNYVFITQIQKWILFSVAILLLLFIAFYFIGYIYIGCNNFELRLLILVVPALVEIYLVINTFVDLNYKLFFSDAILSMSITIISIICTIITTFILKSRLKEAKIELSIYQRNINKNSYVNYIDYDIIRSSHSERVRLERAIIELYTQLQERSLLPSKALDFLKRFDIPQNFANKIIERTFETSISSLSSLSLLEFAQKVLPEYYHSENSSKSMYRNSSMDMRMFEDLYDRFRRLFVVEKRELTYMKDKIEELSQIFKIENKIENKVDIKNQENSIVGEKSCQNQIRELFHALEAPIATTEIALSNLQVSFKELNNDQLKKIQKIQNNLKLIKTVLYAYRELTFMTIRSSDSAFLPLPSIIQSIKDFLGFETNSKILVNGLPDEITYYSTNLVTILILPLLQNALEATPQDKDINVNYTDLNDYHVIKVSNYCLKLPSQTNLQTDGYSSKGNNHIGTGISIVRRVSNIVGINFMLSVNNNQVMATLELPKKK